MKKDDEIVKTLINPKIDKNIGKKKFLKAVQNLEPHNIKHLRN